MAEQEEAALDEQHSARSTGEHLITQNLMSSASLFEQPAPLPESAVEDLAAFIDVFCLYDRLTVLGTPPVPQHGKWESDFLGLVHDSGIVTNEGAYLRDSERSRKIVATAQRGGVPAPCG
jgi:hypothetical protein